MSRHVLVSALAASLALAALGGAWVLRQRHTPVVALTARLPAAENAMAVPASLFEGGAVVEVTADAVLLNGRRLFSLAERERPARFRYWSGNAAFREALRQEQARIEQRHALGEGPPFTGNLLLAMDKEVPVDVAGDLLFSLGFFPFVVYFLVDDPSPAPLEPRPRRCDGYPIVVRALASGGVAPVLTDDYELLTDLASQIRSAKKLDPPPSYIALANEGFVPWQGAVAALDGLRPLEMEAMLLTNDRYPLCDIEPPPPLPERILRRGDTLAVLRQSAESEDCPRPLTYGVRADNFEGENACLACPLGKDGGAIEGKKPQPW